MNAAATVERWARETQERLRAVYQEAAQDVADNVSVGGQHSPGTPVDTGFARSRWEVSTSGAFGVAVQKPAGLTKNELLGTGMDMNLVIGAADLSDVITLYNNAAYLVYLESGYTPPKAPFVSGWIAMTVAAFETIVTRAARRVKAAQ